MSPKFRAGLSAKGKDKPNSYLGRSFIVPRLKLDPADARVLPSDVREIQLTVDSLKPGTRTCICKREYTDARGSKKDIVVTFSSKTLGTLISKKRDSRTQQ
jgi:hypothetical protein